MIILTRMAKQCGANKWVTFTKQKHKRQKKYCIFGKFDIKSYSFCTLEFFIAFYKNDNYGSQSQLCVRVVRINSEVLALVIDNVFVYVVCHQTTDNVAIFGDKIRDLSRHLWYRPPNAHIKLWHL